MKNSILLLICFIMSVTALLAQDVDGYRFLKRIRGIKLDDSKIQEILIDEKTNNIAISYRSKKILYLSIVKLNSWDLVNDYRLDGNVELSNSIFSSDGNIFYANIDAYKLLFAKIDLATGSLDTVECGESPRGCAPADITQYKSEYTTDDKMYYFTKDVDHPNDLLVYVDQVYFKTIEDQMEEELGRDVYAKEVKDKLEADARKSNGPLPGANSTSTASNTTSTKSTKSIIITEDDIVQLLETGNFDKGDISIKLNEAAKKTLQTATANPAIGKAPKSIESITYKVGEVVKLNNILFEQGKSELIPSSFVELDKLVSIMKANPNMNIQVNGHTNNIGTHNLEISESRAKAVVDYLASKGINPSRMTFKGYGDTQPIASNNTEDGQARNRRVEFVIIKN